MEINNRSDQFALLHGSRNMGFKAFHGMCIYFARYHSQWLATEVSPVSFQSVIIRLDRIMTESQKKTGFPDHPPRRTEDEKYSRYPAVLLQDYSFNTVEIFKE
jgi:hypothetical protein